MQDVADKIVSKWKEIIESYSIKVESVHENPPYSLCAVIGRASHKANKNEKHGIYPLLG